MSLPGHFVMYDDKGKHLARVQTAAKNLGVDFHGIRYGFLDEKVKQFNLKRAHEQLSEVKDILHPDAQKAIMHLNLPVDQPIATTTSFYIAEKKSDEPPRKRQRLFFSSANTLQRSASVTDIDVIADGNLTTSFNKRH